MNRKLTLVLLCFISQSIPALTRYWIGGTSTSWTNTANWGTSSGAGAPASVPGSTDVAVFDGNSFADCVLSASIAVSTVSLTSGFTRSLVQGNNIIYINGNSSWAGGNFIGGASNFTNTGTFNINGTNFTSTSASLVISGSFSFSSGAFSHNNGQVLFSTNSLSITGSPLFYNMSLVPYYNTITCNNSFTVSNNLTLDGNSAWVVFGIASGQSVTVNGHLTISGNNQVTINTGTLVANGNITLTNSSTLTGGTGTLRITGTGNQTLTGQGTIGQGALPNVIISKSSGTLSMASYITVRGPLWNYAAGNVSTGTSTLCFYNTGSPFTIAGTQTLGNVVLYGNYSTYDINNNFTAANLTLDASLRCDVTVSSEITITNTLYLSGSGYHKLNTGTVNVKGDIQNNNTNTTTGGGTAKFIINGTGNQTLTGTPLINQGALPPLYINKTSGTLYLSGFVTLYKDFTWVAGSVDSGTSTCVFPNLVASGSQSINANPASFSFYNVVFDQPDYTWTVLQTGIKALGSITITAGSGIRTNSNVITLSGNFTCLNTTAAGASYVFYGGTGCSLSLVGSGSGAQTITSNNATGLANRAIFYDLVINNTAGRSSNDDVILADIMTVTHSATFTSGKLLSTSSANLSLKDGATTNIGSSSSYVNGPMRYEMALSGNRQLNFPIGEGANWRYIQLNLTHNNSTSYTYESQVVAGSPITSHLQIPATVNNISGVRYFQINRLLTSSSATTNAGLSGNQFITIYYDSDDLVTDYAKLTIVKSNTAGVAWHDIGGTASANTTGTIISTSSPSAFDHFSNFALGNKLGGLNVLPVQLTNFTARLCSNMVCINWQTASEKNCDYFEVEKSRDGVLFNNVGKVKGGGTRLTPAEYNLTDNNPENGLTYYRLIQVDNDGRQHYSNVVYVNATGQMQRLTVFPNPSSGKLYVNETSGESLRVYDSAGRLSGRYIPVNGSLDLTHLNEGVYYILSETAGARFYIIRQ